MLLLFYIVVDVVDVDFIIIVFVVVVVAVVVENSPKRKIKTVFSFFLLFKN